MVTTKVGYAGYSLADLLAGIWDVGGILRTTDSGRSWQKQKVRLPFRYRPGMQTPCSCTGPIYTVPAFTTPTRGVMAVLLPTGPGRGTLAFYETTDQGSHWTLASTLPATNALLEYPGTSTLPIRGATLVSIAGQRVWWVADQVQTGARTSSRIRLTVNGGRSWTTMQTNLGPGAESLDATGANTAWATLTVYSHDGFAEELEQTTDRGKHWVIEHLP
jgi:photosystem II stability/assembly factor-like uncharacterized protein